MEKGMKHDELELQDTTINTQDEEAGESEALKQRKNHSNKL